MNRIHKLCLIAPALAVPMAAQAEWKPKGPITLMIAFAAGGGADSQARLIAEEIEARKGWKIIPEAVTGKGGGVMAARLAIADGKAKQAEKIVKAAWATDPHPDLAAAFAEIAPGETPAERVKRFRPLLANMRATPRPRCSRPNCKLLPRISPPPAARLAIWPKPIRPRAP